MTEKLLPKDFQDLEAFATYWALPTGNERADRRRESTMEQIQAFYDAILPRMDAVMEYLNTFAIDELPEEAKPLLYLSLALAEVSRPVELYGRPGAEGLDESRFVLSGTSAIAG